jgi:hypothetical protein
MFKTEPVEDLKAKIANHARSTICGFGVLGGDVTGNKSFLKMK